MAYKELVNAWEDITLLDADKRGPALKSRLYREASVFRHLLARDELKKPSGTEYFLNNLRTEFMKGAQSVFLYRFFGFLKLRRGRMEMVRWVTRWSLHSKRLTDSWMYMYVPVQLTDAEREYRVRFDVGKVMLCCAVSCLSRKVEN